ncbi:hypothetical protein AVEN_237954-1 [Araneus ventricosus]|uniref:Uncharacterized protein n=1 Tax=Araneus ventricosus TaxID=182803 RepID=A0A4Y2SCU2_ARAVE|nr:hypothetical protein AVEN_237954-1 [Araneus ventricosus]
MEENLHQNFPKDFRHLSTAREDNNGLKIFFTFDAPESDGYCKQRFASCPFSAMQIIKGLMPIRSLQRQLPSSDMQLDELDPTEHHNPL